MVTFRVTESQKALLDEKIKKSNLSKSDYLIKSSLDKEIIVINGFTEIFKDFTKQLRPLNNNLNQAMILAHQGKINNVNINDVCKVVNDIWQSLNSLTIHPKH